jgi:hypothetical protein
LRSDGTFGKEASSSNSESSSFSSSSDSSAKGFRFLGTGLFSNNTGAFDAAEAGVLEPVLLLCDDEGSEVTEAEAKDALEPSMNFRFMSFAKAWSYLIQIMRMISILFNQVRPHEKPHHEERKETDLIASLQSTNDITRINGSSIFRLDSVHFFADESVFLVFVFEGNTSMLPQGDPRAHRNIDIKLLHYQ